jgi:hypothetical protein
MVGHLSRVSVGVSLVIQHVGGYTHYGLAQYVSPEIAVRTL